MRLFIAALLVLPFLAAPGNAQDGPLVVPISFHNGDCRPSTGLVAVSHGTGGCAADLVGSFTATCDPDFCDVHVDAVGTGTRGTSEPAADEVVIRVLYNMVWYPSISQTQRGSACTHGAIDATATCHASLDRHLIVEDQGDIGRCANLYLDVQSTTNFGVDTPVGWATVHRTQQAASADVYAGDTRPPAPMWYICQDAAGTLSVTESGWLHTPY